MKLLIAAAALLAGVSAKPGTIRKLEKAAATPKLMNKAMKYSDFVAKHGVKTPADRKLDQDWEIDGTYSIKPQECVNFQVQSEDIYDEDIIAYAAQGDALPEASYVIFQIVSSNVAYYENGSDDSSISWIAPLGEYMEASVTYKAAMKEDFCEQCQRNEEYCGYGDQQQEEQEEEEGEEEGDEGRKLAAFERKLAGNYINCYDCTANNCWENEDEEGQDQDNGYMDDEELVEYVTELAGCAESGLVVYTSGGEELELSAGFICGNNTFGGPEIGLFLDDACTIYYKPLDYYTAVKGNNNNAYYNQDGDRKRKLDDQIVLSPDQLDTISDYISDPYNNGIDCAAFVEYDEYNDDQNGDEEEDQNEEQDYEANEICQQIMEAEAVPLATCGYENGEEQEDAEEEAEDEWEGNEYNFISEYELTEDEVEDIQAVCTFYNTYDWEMYKGDVYQGEVHYSDPNTSASSWASVNGLSAGAKFGIAALVLAVVGGIAFVALKKKKSADDYKLEPLHESKGTSA